MPLPPTLLLVAYERLRQKFYEYVSTYATRLWRAVQQVHRWTHSCRYRRLIDLL